MFRALFVQLSAESHMHHIPVFASASVSALGANSNHPICIPRDVWVETAKRLCLRLRAISCSLLCYIEERAVAFGKCNQGLLEGMPFEGMKGRGVR